MLSFLNKKPGFTLGIDIGLTSIKILELSSALDQYCVEGFSSVELPTHLNDPAEIIQYFNINPSNSNFLSKKAVIALPNSQVISKIIQLSAHIPERDIEDWILMDVEKYMPYSLQDIHLDFNILGPSAQDVSQLDVLLIIARAESVQRRVEVVKRMGFEVQVVEVESHAIERASCLWTSQQPLVQQENYSALFDIHRSCVRCFVFKGHHIISSREDALDVIENLQTFQTHVLQSIKRHLQFTASDIHHERLHSIVLAGGMGEINELCSLIQRNFGIHTYVANPFVNMTFVSDELKNQMNQHASEWMIACGLALRR